jgi:hypothetical protein
MGKAPEETEEVKAHNQNFSKRVMRSPGGGPPEFALFGQASHSLAQGRDQKRDEGEYVLAKGYASKEDFSRKQSIYSGALRKVTVQTHGKLLETLALAPKTAHHRATGLILW